MFEHNRHAGLPVCDVIDRPERDDQAEHRRPRARPGRRHRVRAASRSARCCRPSSSCASATARAATRCAWRCSELQELGLISRRKNVGTRVEAARPTAGFTQSLASVDDLAQFGADARARRARRRARSSPTWRWPRSSAARAAAAGCASRACAWTAARSAGRSAGPTSTSTRPTPTSAELVRESPETLISSLIETRYGRRIARIRQDVER